MIAASRIINGIVNFPLKAPHLLMPSEWHAAALGALGAGVSQAAVLNVAQPGYLAEPLNWAIPALSAIAGGLSGFNFKRFCSAIPWKNDRFFDGNDWKLNDQNKRNNVNGVDLAGMLLGFAGVQILLLISLHVYANTH